MSAASSHSSSNEDIIAGFGQRLQRQRKRRGWTLSEASDRLGLSEAYLSRLEAGRRQPSLAALIGLARVYRTTVSDLLGEGEGARASVKVTPGQAWQTDGLTCQVVSNTAYPDCTVLLVDVPPGRIQSRTHSHPGIEWIYILDGELRLWVDNEPVELRSGEAAHFGGTERHRLENASSTSTRLLLATVSHDLEDGAGHVDTGRLDGGSNHR